MIDHLLKQEQVAEYLQISPTQVAHVIACAGFPRPCVLPSRGTGARPPLRWMPEQVKEWAKLSQGSI